MTASPPNILLLITHDLGTHLGCYGWDPMLRTPHLDRFAATGVRFDNYFAVAPFCSPSRGGICTGVYPHMNGLMGLVNLGWDLGREQVTLAQALGGVGYDTVLFGLQHVAADTGRLGFGRVVDNGRYDSVAVAPMIEAFLRERAPAPRARPFFAQVGFHDVHRPFDFDRLPASAAALRPLPFLEDTDELRRDMAMFYGVVTRMDAAMGRIFRALDECSLSRHTLVVFTTDHGIGFPRAKGTLYDPGLRTTLLMRWPEGFRGGRVIGRLLSNIDLFPTLVEMAGGRVAGHVRGRSFNGLLHGRDAPVRDAVFAVKNTQPEDLKRGIRTRRYKYIMNMGRQPRLFVPVDSEVSLTRRGMGDAHLAPGAAVELYDLEHDPWERRNLAGAPAYAAVQTRLATQLQQFLDTTGDPARNGAVSRPAAEKGLLAAVFADTAVARRRAVEEQLDQRYRALAARAARDAPFE